MSKLLSINPKTFRSAAQFAASQGNSRRCVDIAHGRSLDEEGGDVEF